jgi:putative nucleotidyltransferase-like protein
MCGAMADDGFDAFEATLKKAVAAFREAEVPTLLGGSLAIWARGGPETRHDLDFMVKPDDAERALQALVDVGMRPERPPEGWLYKAWDGEVLVDIIFQPRGLTMTDEVFARGETREVMAISVNMMSLEDVFATKLLALDEHDCDYSALILRARSLREQIDWDELRDRTEEWPFARAFFTLAEGLGIKQQHPVVQQEDDREHRRVRVVD